MFARGRTVVSAWWVGWWCWNIPADSSWADCDREFPANTHAAGKGCLLGAGSDSHPGLALCLNLILPPICKRQCLKPLGLPLDRGVCSQPCCGWGRCPMSAALHMCLGQLGKPVSIQAAWWLWHKCAGCAYPPACCSVWKRGCVLLTRSCQRPCVTPAGAFPWASSRSCLWALLSAWRIAAGRFCTRGEQCPPVFYLLAPAKGSIKQFTRLNKYLGLLWRANIA